MLSYVFRMANYPSKIIDSIFEGARQMSRDLTVPEANKAYAPSTIQSWKDAGYIPAQHHEWILQRGRELGKAIGPADFFDLSEAGGSADGAAA